MNPRKLGILSAAHFFTDLNLGSLPAVLPFLIAAYGFDYRDVAGLMFASSCLSTVVQPVFGWLADRSSKNLFMGGGLLLTGLSFGAVGFLENYWAIFAAVILSGVGSAVFHPQAAKLTNLISGEKRGTGISVFSVGGNGGFGVGPLLAAALITAFGLKGLAFYGVCSLLIGIPLLIYGPRMTPAVAPQSVQAKKAPAAGTGGNDWHAFGLLTVFIVLRSICYTGVLSFLPLYCIHGLGASPSAASAAISVISFAGIICTFFGGPLADRFGCVRMILVGSLLLVPATALAVFPESLIWVYAMLIPISLAFNISYSPFVVLGQTYLSKSVGFASGVTLGISFSAGGIVAPALGWYGDIHGIAATMGLIVGLSALAALSALLLKQPAGSAEKTVSKA